MKYAGRDLLDAGWQGEPTGLSYLFGFIRRQFLVLFLTPLVFLAAGLTFLITAQPQYTATSSLFVRLGPLAQTTTRRRWITTPSWCDPIRTPHWWWKTSNWTRSFPRHRVA